MNMNKCTIGTKKRLKTWLAALAMVSLVAGGCKTEKDYAQTMHDPVLFSKTVKKLNDVVLENNFPQ